MILRLVESLTHFSLSPNKETRQKGRFIVFVLKLGMRERSRERAVFLGFDRERKHRRKLS